MSRAVGYLRRHPVVCLLILTPGIPEYLSGSSALSAIVLNPPLFVLQLAGNLGLYGPGALLIREAMIRGRKGWPSLVVWGIAYAVLEEGIALSTLFNPAASVVGSLGIYGHFAGVNWVWTIGLVMFHTVYSIALPLLLLSLALPETRGQSLLTPREMRWTVTVLGVDVAALSLVVLAAADFWMGMPLFVGSAVTVALLTWVGFRLDSPPTGPRPAPSQRSPWWVAFAGAILFPGTLLTQGILAALSVPAAITFVAVGVFYAVWGLEMRPVLENLQDRRSMVALAAGLLTPVMVFGVLARLPLPLQVIGDGIVISLLVWLWHQYSEEPVRPISVPSGAAVG